MAREIVFYKRHFLDFYDELDRKGQEKIDFVLQLIRTVERVPAKFLKHLEGTDALYEVRVEHRRTLFRIIGFFDEGKLMILLNGFQKKSPKTPKNEIELAERLRKEYFSEMRSS